MNSCTAFGHEAKRAKFDSQSGVWTIHVTRLPNVDRLKTSQNPPEEVKARILISCMGALSVPRECGIQGSEKFQGPLFHSARWNHSADLVGKNVVVIGELLKEKIGYLRPGFQEMAAQHLR